MERHPVTVPGVRACLHGRGGTRLTPPVCRGLPRLHGAGVGVGPWESGADVGVQRRQDAAHQHRAHDTRIRGQRVIYLHRPRDGRRNRRQVACNSDGARRRAASVRRIWRQWEEPNDSGQGFSLFLRFLFFFGFLFLHADDINTLVPVCHPHGKGAIFADPFEYTGWSSARKNQFWPV